MSFKSIAKMTAESEVSCVLETDQGLVRMRKSEAPITFKFGALTHHSSYSPTHLFGYGLSGEVTELDVTACSWTRNADGPMHGEVEKFLGNVHLTRGEVTALELLMTDRLSLYGTIQDNLFDHLIKEASSRSIAAAQFRVSADVMNNGGDGDQTELAIILERDKRIPVSLESVVLSSPL